MTRADPDPKLAVQQMITELEPMLRELALRLHANPELSGEEFQAAQWLTESLRTAGFTVEESIGLPTAFRAVWEGQPGGPTIGLLAEYDALPGLGHACGHNLIASSSLGAALAIRHALPDLKGRIVVIGCPQEEKGQGKVHLNRAGLFDDLDAAMLCHPSRRTMAVRGGLAAVSVTFKFYGLATHASTGPEKGISALDAVIQSFNAINALRQMVPDGNRIMGIITQGGLAPNIVPEYCEAKFSLRSPTNQELEALKARVYRAVRGAAESVGARVEIEEGISYPERHINLSLADLFRANMEALGERVDEPFNRGGIGTSDISVVCHTTATIHPYIKIAAEGVLNHTTEFRDAAGSEDGLRGMIKAAKALAMTAVDLITDSEALKRIRSEHESWKAGQESLRD